MSFSGNVVMNFARLLSSFFGVICAHQLWVAIGVYIRDLEIIVVAGEANDLNNAVPPPLATAYLVH